MPVSSSGTTIQRWRPERTTLNGRGFDANDGMQARYVVTEPIPAADPTATDQPVNDQTANDQTVNDETVNDQTANDQTATLAFLADPATFGVDKVERIDTHISSVFLAGERAYKLKRAVRFSYLDFSTIERRRAACENELRLNRRTAPGLYLAVEPVCRDRTGTFRLGGGGEPVDHVVVMRRFSQENLLDNIARRGGLTREMVQDLADAIALFHENAERDAAFGSPEWLGYVIEGNERNLRLAGKHRLDEAQISRLTRESAAAVARLAAVSDGRRRDGKVRLCHGDLHLRNICLLDGRPTLFDCIEFDRALACIDVLYDLSFLLMDLQHRRFPEWANLAFNRYFDMTGEAAGAQLLPLFMSLHAAIRSHVGLAAPAASTGPGAEKVVSDSRAYLAEALAMLAVPKPALLAIGGASGTGKSTIAYGIAPLAGGVLGARVLRSDVIRKRLAGIAPEMRLPAESYTPAASERVYEAMLEEAAQLLKAGQGVILDAVFGKPTGREAVAALASTCAVPFKAAWLEAGPDIRRQRVEGRARDASDATSAILDAQLREIERPTDWTSIDVAGAGEQNLAAARKVLLPAG